MRKNVLDSAIKIIDERRYNAENVAKNSKIKALENKDFKKLYDSYIDKVIENARKGGDERETKNLQKEVENFVKKLGLPSISPIYNCKECNDTGFIDGRYCKCLTKEINNILKEESGFSKLEDFKNADFEIFSNKEYMKKVYSKMKEWCHSNFNKTIVLLSGQTGVGKTHLAKCMANELIEENKVVLLTSSFALNQDFLKSYSTKALDEKDYILKKYIDAEILFIDDLGTELRQPGITVNYLYLILNERKLNKRPTIITTNLTLADIRDYYDERISSRIADSINSICIYIEGNDLRMKK